MFFSQNENKLLGEDIQIPKSRVGSRQSPDETPEHSCSCPVDLGPECLEVLWRFSSMGPVFGDLPKGCSTGCASMALGMEKDETIPGFCSLFINYLM